MVLGGKPRKVKCSRCAYLWEARAEDALPEPKPVRKPAGKPGAKPEAKKPVKKKKKAEPAYEEPAPEPLERFPGMAGFDFDEPPTMEHPEPSSFGDDAWMNASSHGVDFGSFDGEESRGKQGLGAKIRGLGRWIGFFVSIAGLVVFLLGSRNQLVELWPAAARLYDVVGMPAELPGAGLLLQNYKSELRVDNGVTLLALEGQIANISTAERAVPVLMATSKGPDGKPVKSWRVAVTPNHLAPGAIAIFRSSERDPGAISTIDLNFTNGP